MQSWNDRDLPSLLNAVTGYFFCLIFNILLYFSFP